MKKIYISPETGVLTVKVATLLTVSLSQTTGYAGEAAEARARGKKTDEFTEEEEEEPAEPVQEERPDEPAVTNIQALEGILTEQDAFYNLNGMRVNRLQKGVYIHHGKKVVIK